MIVWGWRTYAQILAVLTLVCGNCGVPAEHVLRRMTTKFTLFWIPLFPVGRKHILACSSCQTEAKVSAEQAAQLAAGGAPQQQPAPAQPPYQGPPTPGPQPAYGPPPPKFHVGPPPQPYPGPPGYGPPPPNYGPPHPGHPMPGPAPYRQPGYPPAGYPPPHR